MPNWLLIVEAVLFGLVIGLSLPVWPLIPMFLGVRETTPPRPARRVYILLLLFPVVTAASLTAAFFTDPNDPLRWLFALLPPLHLLVQFFARVRN
ncbi:MAG: hypothetical protein EXS16_08885 [Gemmataceae bacterium]|nr:hypothetical protein [Gemmataceae bacterium]